MDFMVAPCINNIRHFIVQLMHTNYKSLSIIKIVKIIKAAPTCFSSHKTIIREPHPVLSYPSARCTIHTRNRSRYAAITLTSITTRTLVPDM